ncbi:MAG TPA: four helix bundle protein [Candidatus Acidoferrales bacterium]|nr:four helix bundle protein [Candidatus Acidoferrales bacterium]
MAESSQPKHYKDLIVWQKSMLLAKSLHLLTETFPPTERYVIVAQMRRASVAIPSNIAEGQARHATSDFMHFLSRASGSLAELETLLLLSLELGFCNQEAAEAPIEGVHEIQKMIAAIRRKLGGL